MTVEMFYCTRLLIFDSQWFHSTRPQSQVYLPTCNFQCTSNFGFLLHYCCYLLKWLHLLSFNFGFLLHCCFFNEMIASFIFIYIFFPWMLMILNKASNLGWLVYGHWLQTRQEPGKVVFSVMINRWSMIWQCRTMVVLFKRVSFLLICLHKLMLQLSLFFIKCEWIFLEDIKSKSTLKSLQLDDGFANGWHH